MGLAAWKYTLRKPCTTTDFLMDFGSTFGWGQTTNSRSEDKLPPATISGTISGFRRRPIPCHRGFIWMNRSAMARARRACDNFDAPLATYYLVEETLPRCGCRWMSLAVNDIVLGIAWLPETSEDRVQKLCSLNSRLRVFSSHSLQTSMIGWKVHWPQ